MRYLLSIVLLASCGSGDGGQDSAQVDARIHPAVTVDANCQPYTVTITAADGSRTVNTTLWAIIADVGPNDAYVIEWCGRTPDPYAITCPAGATCSGSLVPPGARCERNNSSGSFVDGKLLVYCGQSSETFAGNGSRTGSTSLSYSTVRVSH